MWLGWFLSTLAFAADPPAEGVRLALTIDDLPMQTVARGKVGIADPVAQARISDAMLKALSSRAAPATVFVNCGLLDGPELLSRWHRAGFELGNHTSTHARASALELSEWSTDVRSCHEVIAQATGSPPRWFRYPYLRRGDPERRAAGEAALAALGERSVPVTIPSAEWRLAQLYDATDDPARRQALREALVAHVVEGLALARRQVSERHPGLEIPHILLLHVNALEADALGLVLDRLRADGVALIPLAEAMSDPFYARPDVALGDRSLPWQLRVAPAWEPGQPNGFWELEAAVDARFAPR